MARSGSMHSIVPFIKPRLLNTALSMLKPLDYPFRHEPDCRYIIESHRVCKLTIDLRFIGIDQVLSLYVPEQDKGLSRDLAYYGCREPIHTRILWKIIETMKPVVLDIGSNIGYFPLIELEAGAKHVIAVEPVPISFNVLRRNLRSYDQRVTLINAAVVEDYKPYVQMRVSNRLNAATISNRGNLTIRAVNINELLKVCRPDIIRMDIEGYEWRVLSAINDADKLLAIDIETHFISDLRLVVRALRNLHRLGFRNLILIKGLRVIPQIAQQYFSSITRFEMFLMKFVPRLRKHGLVRIVLLKDFLVNSSELIEIFGKHLFIVKELT